MTIITQRMRFARLEIGKKYSRNKLKDNGLTDNTINAYIEEGLLNWKCDDTFGNKLYSRDLIQ